VIVLDEQLLGRKLEREIARWYRGAVHFIIDLRPNSIIKDKAIPTLLRQLPQPTFVTINERDFWHQALADARYCMICFALSDSRAGEIPRLLRSVLHHPQLRTKGQRMGRVVRVTEREVSYYTTHGAGQRLVL
jgi:hypothetical protein